MREFFNRPRSRRGSPIFHIRGKGETRAGKRQSSSTSTSSSSPSSFSFFPSLSQTHTHTQARCVVANRSATQNLTKHALSSQNLTPLLGLAGERECYFLSLLPLSLFTSLPPLSSPPRGPLTSPRAEVQSPSAVLILYCMGCHVSAGRASERALTHRNKKSGRASG